MGIVGVRVVCEKLVSAVANNIANVCYLSTYRAFWDFFEALTEGIGEASANQLAYLLSLGATSQAKNLCYGVIYMAVTEGTCCLREAGIRSSEQHC